MRTNYVLIDYENVQPTALSQLEREHFKVIVFVGESQSKIPFELAAQLQRMGENADYVKISGNGSNALDFHIAYYIGRLAAADPDGSFHIISKDAGFDPLIAHLKTQQIRAGRFRNIGEIPGLNVEGSQNHDEKLPIIIDRLRRFGPTKPGSIKTLTGTINSFFGKTLTESELTALVRLMELKGLLTVTGVRVVYSFPDDDGSATQPSTSLAPSPDGDLVDSGLG